MNLDGLVDQMYDYDDVELDDVKSYVDRLLLRIFNAVSLMQYLNKVSVLKKGNVQTVQLVFAQVPADIIPEIQRIIGVPSQAYAFDKDGSPYIGFEIPLPDEVFRRSDNRPLPLA
jgi:hypothetical protein